jgi:hypothetical protein
LLWKRKKRMYNLNAQFGRRFSPGKVARGKPSR